MPTLTISRNHTDSQLTFELSEGHEGISRLRLDNITFEPLELDVLTSTFSFMGMMNTIDRIHFVYNDFSNTDMEGFSTWMNSLEFLTELEIEGTYFGTNLYSFMKATISENSRLEKIILIAGEDDRGEEVFLENYTTLLHSLQGVNSLIELNIQCQLFPQSKPIPIIYHCKLLSNILLNNPKLQTIYLDGIGLDDEFIEEFITTLYLLKSLRTLTMAKNLITDKGAFIIARYLKEIHNLTALEIENNKFFLALMEFADLQEYNPVLKTLTLDSDTIQKNFYFNQKLEYQFLQKYHKSLMNNKNSVINIEWDLTFPKFDETKDDTLAAEINTLIEKIHTISEDFKTKSGAAPTLADVCAARYTRTPPSLFSLVARFFRTHPNGLKNPELKNIIPQDIFDGYERAHPPYIMGKATDKSEIQELYSSQDSSKIARF